MTPVKAPDDLAAYVNCEEAIRRFRGNTPVFKRILTSYLAKNPYADFCDALAAGDFAMAEHHAHSLKGAAANMSLNALQDTCARVEAALKKGELTDELESELAAAIEKTNLHITWVLENL
ncbi:MAG: Hpt domain-containing protein [Oscillospiraceae bacterium]|nr:Hpt domain-containing protein [Oscillospiraceae bacterium]